MNWGRYLKKKAASKYGAQRTSDGFPSKLESAVHQILLLRERAKELLGIRRQHRIQFPCGVGWKVDFSFTETASGETVFCEAKGVETETYRLKKTMYCKCPILADAGKLEVWKGSHTKPYLDEVIIPKQQTKGVA